MKPITLIRSTLWLNSPQEKAVLRNLEIPILQLSLFCFFLGQVFEDKKDGSSFLFLRSSYFQDWVLRAISMTQFLLFSWSYCRGMKVFSSFWSKQYSEFSESLNDKFKDSLLSSPNRCPPQLLWTPQS